MLRQTRIEREGKRQGKWRKGKKGEDGANEESREGRTERGSCGLRRDVHKYCEEGSRDGESDSEGERGSE